METDYVRGDAPVQVGSVVEYFGSGPHGRYRVIGRQKPTAHPYRSLTREEAAEAYPDGVAYDLWPTNLPQKFGLRDQAVTHVRRTSFTVISRPWAPQGGLLGEW